MKWDDYRIVLGVARAGSIRKAALGLALDHSTVSKRLAAIEGELEARLFDRTPEGYVPTDTGTALVRAAENIEEAALAAERAIAGADRALEGPVTVSMPDIIAYHLLVDELDRFCDEHPDIELTLKLSFGLVDLDRREADVVLRVTDDPPENLVGRRLLTSRHATYASPAYLDSHDFSKVDELGWIGWPGDDTRPNWVVESIFDAAPVRLRMNDLLTRHQAARAGLGLVRLPCFMGDPDPELVRLADDGVKETRELWVLTHPDLRNNARIRKCMSFFADTILAKRDLIEGKTKTLEYSANKVAETVGAE